MSEIDKRLKHKTADDFMTAFNNAARKMSLNLPPFPETLAIDRFLLLDVFHLMRSIKKETTKNAKY